MKEYKARSAGHAAIVIALDEHAPSPDALLGYFEDAAANGRRFQPDETIQFGWMMLLLKKGEGGTLEVWEPMPDSMPIQWCRGANSAIRHVVLQLSVCKELGCEPEFPSLRHAGIVSPDFLASSEFQMTREEPDENDSGWGFSTLEYVDEEAEYRSLFEVSVHRPEVIPFLALPSDAAVTISESGIEVELDGVAISSESSELLRKLLGRR